MLYVCLWAHASCLQTPHTSQRLNAQTSHYWLNHNFKSFVSYNLDCEIYKGILPTQGLPIVSRSVHKFESQENRESLDSASPFFISFLFRDRKSLRKLRDLIANSWWLTVFLRDNKRTTPFAVSLQGTLTQMCPGMIHVTCKEIRVRTPIRVDSVKSTITM